jgi:hypothetical protein
VNKEWLREKFLYNNYSNTRNLIGQYIRVQDETILHGKFKCLPRGFQNVGQQMSDSVIHDHALGIFLDFRKAYRKFFKLSESLETSRVHGHAILNGKPFGIPNLSLKTTQNTFQSLGCIQSLFLYLL